ncbi:Serine/threonine-protein phosphatase PP-Z1 [Wickerhamiella sorbophila]|uniref:Serine/threonine-protein phosphatase n=1 Tax=Wickerhamiella sorbophila TaxID=45607 RepID=A0A2T0FPD1_9ASCO|nr:Serine/threonine-protein phosphatase PP-Z1 [Wickerhamiella sorbophila]PRT56837.1 Serine/threonine-protein phosphatase PP-Z1 [Wickerhamiella sorbophila]
MGQTQSRNGEARTELSIIANDDDEPGGIRGLNLHSNHHHRPKKLPVKQPARPLRIDSHSHDSLSISPLRVDSRDPLQDVAELGTPSSFSPGREFSGRSFLAPSQSDNEPGSIASTLDSYLGRKASPSISKSQAMGTVSNQHGVSAAEALKDVTPRATPQLIPKLSIKDPRIVPPNSIGSSATAGSLTSGSVSSGDSPMTSPESSDEDQSMAERIAARHVMAARNVPSAPSASGIPVNRLIKRICVSGLQNQRAFCMNLDEINSVCRAASELFLSQPVLLELATPVKVVGDTHGQFKDLMRIFRLSGMPPNTNYLFLGDYVDRGKQSLETIMLLFCLKLRFPNNVFLLRGNHECANVTKVYGFYDECKRRSSLKAWRSIVDVFNTLPIAATIGSKIFCVHGGLSPNLTTLQDIEQISRPTDVPDSGLMSDLMWSDPDPQVKEWADNDRGVSYCFGKRVLDQFCNRFKFDLVARGHMVVEDGYEFFGNRKLVTIFSAPNYCGDFDNWGAVMSVDENLLCSFELLEPNKKPSKRS